MPLKVFVCELKFSSRKVILISSFRKISSLIFGMLRQPSLYDQSFPLIVFILALIKTPL